MVVACRVRVPPLLWPLTLWTKLFVLWVGHLPPQPGLASCCLTAGCPFGFWVLSPVVLSLVWFPVLPASRPSGWCCQCLLLCWWLGRLGVCLSCRFAHCRLVLVCRLLP